MLDVDTVHDAFYYLFDDLDTYWYLERSDDGEYQYSGWIACSDGSSWRGARCYLDESKECVRLKELGIVITRIQTHREPDYYVGERDVHVYFKVNKPAD